MSIRRAVIKDEHGEGISATLPVPPSANDYWRYTGRVFTSDKAAAYKSVVGMLGPNRLTGPVAVNMTVYRARKSGDLDNFMKVMFDALQGVLYENDSQIVEIHAWREDDKENPRVELLVYEAKGQHHEQL